MSQANGQSGDVYAQLLGLPPGARPPDHYSLLGIPLFTSNRRTVEEAAHRRMEHLDRIALHPDSATRKAVQRLMTEVAQARVCLVSPLTKAQYDAELSARLGLDHPTVDIGPGPFWRKKPVLIAGAVLAAILIAGASVTAVYVVKSLWPGQGKTTPTAPPVVTKPPRTPIIKPPPVAPPVKIPPKVVIVPPKPKLPVPPLPAKGYPLWDGKETVAQYAARAGIKDVETALDLGDGVSMRLTLIPAGKFMMGSPQDEKDRQSDEGPQHEVTITRPFYMGVFEVTQEQYEKITGKHPSPLQGATRPAERVSWDDALEFCRMLSSRTGMTVSLPTEAQWEYACRAGTKTRFSFGDNDADVGDYAWYFENGGLKTHPVGEKKPNAFGLYDMHGNVWEWCSDWYEGSYQANQDPMGPDTGRFRVLRGGSFISRQESLRSASRDGDLSVGRAVYAGRATYVGIGFRAVVPADTPQPAQLAEYLRMVADANGLLASWPADSSAMTDAQRGDVSKALDAAKRALALKAGDPEALWLKTRIVKYLVPPPIPQPARPRQTGPLPKELALNLGGGVSMRLALIPAGKFMMGSPVSEHGRMRDEGPQHEVTITKPFYMGMFEVTHEQYEQLMGAAPSSIKGPIKDPQCAEERISWDDAAEFCKKLSRQTGWTVSLPTEAQWEYACRAGTTTQFGFGDEKTNLGDYAWYRENSQRNPHPGGGKKPNAFGLYDMQGNVCEWCSDWYDLYSTSGTTDPTGPETGSLRVARGCSWIGTSYDCRSAYRRRFRPDDPSNHTGIRVVAELAPADPTQAAQTAPILTLLAEANALLSSWPADPAAMSVAQRADVPKALDPVKRALAIRPADPDALALKAKIEKIEKYLAQPTSAPSPASGVAPQPATGSASRPTTQPASEADRAAVAKALENARRYLARQIDPATGRSKLEYDAGKWRDGVNTALVLRALAVAGEKYEESRIMQAGYAWLALRPRETTEIVSLRILAICALPKKPSALASCLGADVNWLLGAASVEGGYGSQSLAGKSTPYMGIEGDWAIMALHAASSERMPIPRDFWERNLRAWVDVQLPSGAWNHVPGKLRRSDSFTMSAAGLCAISIAQEHVGKQIAPGDKKTADESYQRGLKWMREHFNLPQPRRGGYGGFASERFPGKGLDEFSPGRELCWHWLLNMARLQTATGEREMGGVDLYWFMARQLLDNQSQDGSFGGKGRATGVFQVQLTAMAVLFLESGLPK